MIYVYMIPEKLSHGYAFGGGNSVAFVNVDWFDGEGYPGGEVPTRAELTDFVKKKRYYRPYVRFLVLGSIPDHQFVIEATEEGP